MKKLFLTITGLLFVALAMTAQNKAGLLIGYDTTGDIESASEKNAAAWFQQNYADGLIFTPSTIGTLSAADVKVLWVMVDRVGIERGWQNLPAAFSGTETIKALKAFVEAGGNLLLTNHATQLTVPVGRIAEAYAPGLWGNGPGGNNPDVWGSQPIIGNADGHIYDHSQHAIYQGMNFVSGLYERSIYPFIGSGVKLDHNCMWDLNAYGLAPNPNVVKTWEETTNSTVLGTWNHVVDYCCAGIVDFEPTTTIQGRILAVGLAAYDWGMGSSNTYLDQLEKFTANCLSYLGYEAGSGGGGGGSGDHAAHFDMSLSGGKVKEEVSGSAFNVVSQLPATAISGLDGEALRFDGYSNYVKASLPAGLNTETLTMSVTLAAETYPMMQVDAAEDTPTYATICGNLDEAAKKGFALLLSSQGDLRLKVAVNYSGGYIVSIDGSQKLPRGQWNRIDMVFDKGSNKCELFLNGESIASKVVNRCDLLAAAGDFYIGKDATEKKSGPFLLNTFCGAIDDIAISNTAAAPAAYTPQTADFNYPAERYAGNLWRPQFHAMPSGSWTNESHGLTYSGGRWHVFFQKNANGPYMSRLHWGHISSENLYEWTEEPIAIYPGESFDIKGCWSGCVYEDGSNHTILYTAVDNGKARIAQAKSGDNALVSWDAKKVVIDGTPSGFADFRDPYYFEANGNKYIIVGTGKNNIGCCTLHKLNGSTWTNDGTVFFQGTSQSQHGTFWEMPNVTPMGNGKWLFTCTPLETSVGVRTLCWVGTIGTDGKFVPDGGIAGMQLLEMNGISRDGYGLLSPSIYPSGDKTLLLGIVPDKLADTENYKMGWSHNFSLPREISVASDGSLVQKPYSGLTGLRTSTTVTIDQTLLGAQSLSPVSGRQIELLGEFTVGSGACGFHFLKKGDKQATLSYDPSTGLLTLDYTTLARVSNDNGSWSAKLPKKVNTGETLKLDVFFDGSIADIFVNDTWAFSVRIFPTDADAVEAEVFSESSASVKVSAWTLDAQDGQGTGIGDAPLLNDEIIKSNKVYDLQGRRLNGVPQAGLYIMNGKKYVCR